MVKLKSVGILAALFAAIFNMNAAAVNNPVSYNTEITDCDVFKYNGEYYISGNWLKGDMLCSRDLETWGGRKHIFSWNNTWHTQVNATNPDFDIHGTHMRYLNGTFYLYAHLDVSSGIVHAISSNIWGPYTEPVNAAFTGNGWLIDADTFVDEDGNLFYYETNRSGSSGHDIRARTMSDLSTLSGSWDVQIQDSQGWEGSVINEGSKVFKYRGRYYMLYNGLGTGDPNYAVGAVEASSPLGFNNSGKYSNNPIMSRTTPAAGKPEITHIGQSWMVEGLNGFEKWFGYFAQTTADGRTQRIDRMHFFDRKLFIDGPTDRYTPGYHPAPAKPQLLNIFSVSDGPISAADWILGPGDWNVTGEELRQTEASGFSNVIVKRDSAVHFLAEANVKLIGGSSGRAGLTVVKDGSDWLRVGLDQTANRWFYQRMDNGAYDAADYALPAGFDYQAYHKIQLQKDGNTVSIRIDDIPSPTLSSLAVNFDGAALPELFTDGAQAAFDGIIYTIGWDEYDSGVIGWGNSINGTTAVGSWSGGANGITMANGTGYTFKGDLMPEYEFAAQVFKEGGTDGSMGLAAVSVDNGNYLNAVIDLATDELVVSGFKGGLALTEQRVGVANKTDYNLRVAKLADRVVFFVDGLEKLTVNEAYAASPVGLYVEGMSARFNGIMTYRTEPDTVPAPWQNTDLGSVNHTGRADISEGVVTINASGWAFWENRDEGHMVYQQISGDVEIIAKVEMEDPADYWTTGGVMIREDLSTDSPMAFVALTQHDASGTNMVNSLGRSSKGGNVGGFGSKLEYEIIPSYVKLSRIGNTFSSYWSRNGANWELLGSTVIAMSADCYVGLSLSANNADRVVGAVFSDVSLVVPPPIVVGQWLQINFTDGFYADAAGNSGATHGGGGQRNWNYMTDWANPAYNASTASTGLIDSLGNTVADINVSSSGWLGGGWSGGAEWGGNGIETAGADGLGGSHLMGRDETINFWWANGDGQTITVSGLSTGLAYNVKLYSINNGSGNNGETLAVDLNGNTTDFHTELDRWNSTTTPYVWNNVSATVGGDLIFTYDVNVFENPVINAIVIEAVESLLSYPEWAEENGLVGAHALRDADPDGDSLDNLAEYALGGDPNVADAAAYLPTYGITDAGGGSNFVDYIYNRRLNAASVGLTYGLNMGTNLTGTWTYVGTSYETGFVDIDQDFESVSNSVPFSGPQGFVQLEILED